MERFVIVNAEAKSEQVRLGFLLFDAPGEKGKLKGVNIDLLESTLKNNYELVNEAISFINERIVELEKKLASVMEAINASVKNGNYDWPGKKIEFLTEQSSRMIEIVEQLGQYKGALTHIDLMTQSLEPKTQAAA